MSCHTIPDHESPNYSPGRSRRDRTVDSRSQSLVAATSLSDIVPSDPGAASSTGTTSDPAKHLVWSNLKIGTEQLVQTGPKTQSPWRGPRNAAMHDRIEEYSTPGAATRWRLRFGAGTMRAASGRLLVCAKIRGVLGTVAAGCTRCET